MMLQTHSLTVSRLALSTISPLVVDRFRLSLRYCHLGKPFLVRRVKMAGIGDEGGFNFK